MSETTASGNDPLKASSVATVPYDSEQARPRTGSGSTPDILESLRLIEDLKFFLATAPANWHENQVIRRYYLNHDEGFVSCVFWNNLYFITGTDIVRCIVYKFEHFGRKIVDRKKFEEGVFSDLRNLKIGTDAILEAPRSEFLEFLFKNSCLRTQKKQKVFFWFNVPHDKLTADALDRDLKKEKMGQKPTTVAVSDPALLFSYDEDKPFLFQLEEHLKAQTAKYKKEPTSPNNGGGGGGGYGPENGTMSMPLMQQPQIAPPGGSVNNSDIRSSHGIKNYNTTKHDNPNANTNGQNYEFLNQETPAQFKQSDEDEDDFPLDYFQNPTNNDDYIQFDPNFQYSIYPSGIPDDKPIDFVVDPSVLFNGATTPTTKVVFNEEYLIEQTVPLKAPVVPPSAIDGSAGPMYMQPPPTAGLVAPQLAYHPPPSATNYSYYFPYNSEYSQYPVSAKYQTAIPKYTPQQQQQQLLLLQQMQQLQLQGNTTTNNNNNNNSNSNSNNNNYSQDTYVKSEYDLLKRKYPLEYSVQRHEPHFQYGQEQELWPMAVPVTPMYAGGPASGVYPPPPPPPPPGVDPYLSMSVNQPYLVYEGDYHNPYMASSSPMAKYFPLQGSAGFRSGPSGLQQLGLVSGHKKNRIQSSSTSSSQPSHLINSGSNNVNLKRARNTNAPGGITKKPHTTTASSSSLEKKSAVLEEVVQSKIAKTRILAAAAAAAAAVSGTGAGTGSGAGAGAGATETNEMMMATPDSSASDTKLK